MFILQKNYYFTKKRKALSKNKREGYSNYARRKN